MSMIQRYVGLDEVIINIQNSICSKTTTRVIFGVMESYSTYVLVVEYVDPINTNMKRDFVLYIYAGIYVNNLLVLQNFTIARKSRNIL